MENNFNFILVANRGEIALRIMRSIRAKGLKCVAVYTVADAEAPHVKFADQAVCIGDGPVQDSYLSIAKILEAAKLTNADAIHPGYGFLSESVDFAKAVEESGMRFIGPSSDAIEAMGNKAEAKRRMIKAGVPCVPGYEQFDQSDEILIEAANSIGFPLMVKASAGGGGRGMRLVLSKKSLLRDINSARSEALNAFGSDELILEKAIVEPRHIEIQIFGDKFGNILHFGERDCSVQRRHQKVIEEAPSPVVSEDLRNNMGKAAVNAAKAINYEGAGTVEFLLDKEGNFYFLEMNTRLQVEHPVTELVTGYDLVALQIEVAQGHKLTISQEDIVISGHAMEVRLYAEDPFNEFLPSSGDIIFWKEPSGVGLRVDSGILEGQTISSFYDPMLAKLITHGENRDEARALLLSALQSAPIFGLKTNRDHLIDILKNESFIDGSATTAFISETYGEKGPKKLDTSFKQICIAAALIYRDEQVKAFNLSHITSKELLGWGSSGSLKSRLKLRCEDKNYDLVINHHQNGKLSITDGINSSEACFDQSQLRIDGVLTDTIAHVRHNGIIYFASPDSSFEIYELNNSSAVNDADGGGRVFAPMHGNLLKVFAENKQSIVKGERLAILEAMKMQHELIADNDGIISSVYFSSGDQVRAGDLLLELDLNEGKE